MGYAQPGILDDPETATCTAPWIARVLGCGTYGDRRRTTYLQRLVEHQGFPAPLPTLRGHDLVEDVTSDSRWIRASVERWLRDRMPPAAIAGLGMADQAAAAAQMDAAAAALQLKGRGR